MMPVVHVGRGKDGVERYRFRCPGCEFDHIIDETWTWNGDRERPTFKPSVLVRGGGSNVRCHSFVREGRIEFLKDCSHRLAGQTVDLPPIGEGPHHG